MNSSLKLAIAAAAVFVVAVAGIACGPVAVAPSSGVPSPEPSPSLEAARMTVAGSALQFTAEHPAGWEPFDFGADRAGDPPGIAFFVSLVDNTFADPCAHEQRSPKVGSKVEALAAALGEIPDTTATEPVQTTLAGKEATYIELTIPASPPCDPDEFYLWQDSPDASWWALAPNELIRVWIIEVGGERVAIAARSRPGTREAVKAELERILDSIVFDGPTAVAPASAVATPSSDLLDTSTWTTYVSERYGFSIAHPSD